MPCARRRPCPASAYHDTVPSRRLADRPFDALIVPVLPRIIPGKTMVPKGAAHPTGDREVRATGVTRVGDHHLARWVGAPGGVDHKVEEVRGRHATERAVGGG